MWFPFPSAPRQATCVTSRVGRPSDAPSSVTGTVAENFKSGLQPKALLAARAAPRGVAGAAAGGGAALALLLLLIGLAFGAATLGRRRRRDADESLH